MKVDSTVLLLAVSKGISPLSHSRTVPVVGEVTAARFASRFAPVFHPGSVVVVCAAKVVAMPVILLEVEVLAMA